MTTPTPTQPTPEQVLLLLADCVELGNTLLPADRRGRLDLIAAHDRAEDALAALDPAHLRALASAQAEQQAQINDLLERNDNLQSVATRRIGLRRELEVELFGQVLPLQDDGGEAVHLRALEVVRGLKARVSEQQERLERVRSLHEEIKGLAQMEDEDAARAGRQGQYALQKVSEGMRVAYSEIAYKLDVALTPTQEAGKL